MLLAFTKGAGYVRNQVPLLSVLIIAQYNSDYYCKVTTLMIISPK